MNEKFIKIDNISKSFNVKDSCLSILENIDLTIKQGEFVVIVGHSGCGKSTLLKILSGLLVADEGSISLKNFNLNSNGKVSYENFQITKPNSEIGMIFQEHRLFPWMTVKENVSFGLKNLKEKERETLIDYHLNLVKLKDFKNAYPHQLSGGMSQRAAIARALVTNPSILLLDEPFGALDALTKITMQQEIIKIWEEQKMTMVMVTHDIEEAIYLADKVVVMSSRPGKIKEIIKVDLERPRDRNSADFGRLKKRVYEHFFNDEKIKIDYEI